MANEHADKQPTALTTPVPTLDTQLAQSGIDVVARPLVASWDVTTPAGALRAMQARFITGVKVEECYNVPISVEAFAVCPAHFLDDRTGEEVTTVVTTLYLSDGRVLKTHSKGVIQCVVDASRVLGFPTDKRPWKCVPRRIPLRNEKSMVILDFGQK